MTRRCLLVPPLLALLASAPGCLGWEQRLVLAPDGSGTATVTATYDGAAAAALRGRVRAALGGAEPSAAGGEPPPESEANPAAAGWFHAQARGVEGLTLEPACTEAREGSRCSTEIAARLTSLEAAARGGLFHGAEVALERRARKRWRFTLRPPWMPSGPGADDAFGGVPAVRLEPAFTADIAALRHDLVITFPVPVLSTNALLSADRRTVTYRSRGGEAPARALEVELELPEEEAWPTFRHSPDLGALARRLVVAPPALPRPPPPEAPGTEDAPR